MAKELSALEKKMKKLMEKNLASPDITWMGRSRLLYSLLPSDPRCASCGVPFEGRGGAFFRTVLNKKRSQMNPLFCNKCEEYARRFKPGIETEMSMLFAVFAAWYASENLPARWYTWGIGFTYLGLLVYGLVTPGLFLNTPFTTPRSG